MRVELVEFPGLKRVIEAEVSPEESLDALKKAYQGEPFDRIMDEGVYPDTRYVRYSNYCDIGAKVLEGDRFVIISAIDNLVKGASGQAVQNMNIALGLDETTGLTALPQFP
jgi:N-acetyl-gamma-glutamyl-phosphate reductase